MRVLVTGASGYIGSQTCKLLTQQGHEVVAYDVNDIPHKYYKTQVRKCYSLIDTYILETVDAVVHVAATSLVGPSMKDPALYYRNNIAHTLQLLERCLAAKMKTFVFASSAGVYGEPSEDVCHENMDAQPCSPYGWSKKMMEIILQDYYTAYNLNSVSLRFFNVAGADTDCEMGQQPDATHIIAKAIELTMAGKDFTLFGKEFDTPDGTCVRDYLHVEDVAQGILNSIELLGTTSGAHTFNLGGERGYSNLEIVDSINRVTPLTVNLKYGDPRAGDPSTLIADTHAANTILNWNPKHDLDSIISTAYKWYNK